MSKPVWHWIRRCPACIRFKTYDQSDGPMQIRLYEHQFHALGMDYVGKLPVSPNVNKWILTAVFLNDIYIYLQFTPLTAVILHLHSHLQ